MKVRRKDHGQEIESRDIDVRQLAKVVFISKAQKDALKCLNYEQKRQWNTYSRREQVQTLNAVDKAVSRRMQHTRFCENEKNYRSEKRPDIVSVYRCGKISATKRKKAGRIQESGQRVPFIREKQMEAGQKKFAKREKRHRRKLYVNELVFLINRDIQRNAGIRQMQRNGQMEFTQADLEHSVRTTVGNSASMPARIWIAVEAVKVKEILTSTMMQVLKYAVALGIPVMVLLIVYLAISALFTGIAGEESESTYSASGYEIVEYAKQWIGMTKYVWGAGRDGPVSWQDYADCSSFVYGVYAHFGYEIGWDTYAQENAGILVAGGLANAMPGDIILFYSGTVASGNSSHVGIYAGEGQMIHCSGNRSNTSAANAGRGACWGTPSADGRPYVVRRIVPVSSGGGEELLAVLASYNTKMELDRMRGIKWWYSNSGTAQTFSGAANGSIKATNCALLIRWALKDMGIIEKNHFFYYTYGNKLYFGNKNANEAEISLREKADIIPVYKTARQLIANGILQAGDICCWHSMQHMNVYAGGNKWYDAGRGGTNGHYEGDTYIFEKWGPVLTSYMNTQVDYIIRLRAANIGNGESTGNHRRDTTAYLQEQMELIWAIVAQEDNGSYKGALAVISSAMNRTESVNWKSYGNNALAQLIAPGQYCYSNDTYWQKRLGGNVPAYVKQAVWDCLKKGVRNHSYTSFRSQKGSTTGPNAVQIGGNWFFGN